MTLETCGTEHRGHTLLEWFEEVDDDRTYLLIIQRCSNCGIPVGAEDYATTEEREAFYRGEKPTRVPV